jgi:hypothetical protein
MATKYANRTNAIGFCARCNFRYKLGLLKPESIRGKVTNLLVCPECWSADHPQNFQGMVPVNDPQAIRDPRPDPSLQESREIPDTGQTLEDIYTPPVP